MKTKQKYNNNCQQENKFFVVKKKTNAHYYTHKLNPKDSIVQFLFTSDVHFGLVKEKFQGKQRVSANDVNLAMVKVMNQFKNIDALVITGDIANRMEGDVQTAAKSWSEFEKVFIDSLHLKNRNNQKSKLWQRLFFTQTKSGKTDV